MAGKKNPTPEQKTPAQKDNMRGARLPDDILVPFDTLKKDLGFEDAELLRRLLRLSLRSVLKDKTLIISADASHPIQ
jgi:hypothetical protein